MKKVIPYLKFIVPIACVLSVSIVVFMAMKVDDLKNQREDKQLEYNTAAEEFYGKNVIENETVENETIENETSESLEDEEDESEDTLIYGNTYDKYKDSEDSDEETSEDGELAETNTSIKENDARKLVVNIYGEDDYTIKYKDVTDSGEYLFELTNKETEEKVLKIVNIEKSTVLTVINE